MKHFVLFNEYEEKGEKYATLDIFAFGLKPEEQKEALAELEAEDVHISAIDADSVRGELNQRYDDVKKVMANLSAKGWVWNEDKE